VAVQKRRKAINFDLDTATLRRLFGESGRRGAYVRIGRFLTKHGFEHRQSSGYQSIRTMSEAEVNDTIVSLYETLPWMVDAVQKLDVTNIGVNYDMHTIAVRQIENRHQNSAVEIIDVLAKPSG
jgi:virulence-associated protein VapD